jgi:glucosamine 6-phosphate synthetase-like amidotransferase/phosphosugar isomerase protein
VYLLKWNTLQSLDTATPSLPKKMVVAISQSGETADTMAALEIAKEKGATIFGVCNVVGASIPRITDAGFIPMPGRKLVLHQPRHLLPR